MKKKPLWERDRLQFARLLAEMQATIMDRFTEEMWEELRESMDLSQEGIDTLLERAQSRWDRAKQRIYREH